MATINYALRQFAINQIDFQTIAQHMFSLDAPQHVQ